MVVLAPDVPRQSGLGWHRGRAHAVCPTNTWPPRSACPFGQCVGGSLTTTAISGQAEVADHAWNLVRRGDEIRVAMMSAGTEVGSTSPGDTGG
jgi:hypothetical protein